MSYSQIPSLVNGHGLGVLLFLRPLVSFQCRRRSQGNASTHYPLSPTCSSGAMAPVLYIDITASNPATTILCMLSNVCRALNQLPSHVVIFPKFFIQASERSPSWVCAGHKSLLRLSLLLAHRIAVPLMLRCLHQGRSACCRPNDAGQLLRPEPFLGQQKHELLLKSLPMLAGGT